MAASANSIFPSVVQFINYFEQHDELRLLPNQPLEIQDISLINEEEDIAALDEPRIQLVTRAQSIYFTLSKMLEPLGKGVNVNVGGSCDVECRIDRGVYLKLANATVIKTEAAMYIQFTNLFRLMVASSISKVTFTPNQRIIILGLQEKETQFDTAVDKILSRAIAPRIPNGFTCNIKTGNGNVDLTSGVTILSQNTARLPHLSVTSGQGLELSLSENYTFNNIKWFRRRLALNGTMVIPAGKTLKISDPLIYNLWKKYEDLFKGVVPRVMFVFSQMLLPLGKTVGFKSEDREAIIEANFNVKEDCIELRSRDPSCSFTIQTEYGDIVTDLKDLGYHLIHHRLRSVKLRPNQELLIYDVDPKELEGWVTSTDYAISKKGIADFLARRNPIGFIWNLKIQDSLSKYHSVSKNEEGKEIHYLKLQSENEMELSLQRASGEALILNIINYAPKTLLKDFMEGDEKAIIFILFKALFYHCCDDYRLFEDKAPLFFKEETQTKIVALMKDEELTEALRKVTVTEEYIEQIDSILTKDHIAFSQLELKNLADPIQKIMRSILNLTYEERQGSPFLTKCLSEVSRQLNNKGEEV